MNEYEKSLLQSMSSKDGETTVVFKPDWLTKILLIAVFLLIFLSGFFFVLAREQTYENRTIGIENQQMQCLNAELNAQQLHQDLTNDARYQEVCAKYQGE